jgi:hypothetical protein
LLGRSRSLHWPRRWRPSWAQRAAALACFFGFVEHYNTGRPHRIRGSLTPLETYSALGRASFGSPIASPHFRVPPIESTLTADVTLRVRSRMLHIGVRIVTFEGELLRRLELDPSCAHQVEIERSRSSLGDRPSAMSRWGSRVGAEVGGRGGGPRRRGGPETPRTARGARAQGPAGATGNGGLGLAGGADWWRLPSPAPMGAVLEPSKSAR